jgi:hypothetical protein
VPTVIGRKIARDGIQGIVRISCSAGQ